jgi:uncharacterized protein Yka (UPF0111/DUF47 family)
MKVSSLMAKRTLPAAEQTAKSPETFSNFANHLSCQVYELMYQAKALHALLEEIDGAGETDELTGMSYLLKRLERDCDQIARDVGDAAFKHTWEAVNHG